MSSTNSKLTRVADNIRILSAAMVEKAKSGHPGGAMGGADFVTVLYTEFLRYDPDNMAYPYRDRFFLDPGHMSPMLYSVLSLAGYYTTEDLQSLRQWGSVTPGHPEVDVMRGVENTSGPLGQGHAMALGAAIAERFMAARFGEWMAHKTYAYISDGAVEEEISQGVGRIAGHLGLSNFIMYYDSNNIQLSTKVDEVDTENVAMKYEAWGWNVLSVDGHNINEIREALVAANSETERPTLIIGHTIMGKGARTTDGGSFEDKVSTHGQPLTAAGADFAATVKNLGGDPENPFAVFEESREAFAERREALRAWAARQAGVEKTWRGEHGELARKLDMFLSGHLPEIDYKSIEVKAGVATRAASATVLGVFAEKIENMIVAFVAVNMAWLGVWYLFVRQQLDLRFLDLLRDVLPFALIALATMAATYYITRGISDIYLLLAAKVVTAAVIYMAMMWVCRAKVLRESIEFLRRRSVRHDR